MADDKPVELTILHPPPHKAIVSRLHRDGTTTQTEITITTDHTLAPDEAILRTAHGEVRVVNIGTRQPTREDEVRLRRLNAYLSRHPDIVRAIRHNR